MSRRTSGSGRPSSGNPQPFTLPTQTGASSNQSGQTQLPFGLGNTNQPSTFNFGNNPAGQPSSGQQSGGFGTPAQGGFGTSTQGGFGTSTQGGFGTSTQGGFGTSTRPATTNQPSTQNPFRTPTQGAFVSSSRPATAPNRFGTTNPSSGNFNAGGFQQPTTTPSQNVFQSKTPSTFLPANFASTPAASSSQSGFQFPTTPAASAPQSGFQLPTTPAASAPQSGFQWTTTPAASAPQSGFQLPTTPAASAPQSGFQLPTTPVASAPQSGFQLPTTPAASAPQSGFQLPTAPVASAPQSNFQLATNPVASVLNSAIVITANTIPEWAKLPMAGIRSMPVTTNLFSFFIPPSSNHEGLLRVLTSDQSPEINHQLSTLDPETLVTPLMALLYYDPWKNEDISKTKEIIDLMISRGAQVNVADSKDYSTLFYIFSTNEHKKTNERALALLQTLLPYYPQNHISKSEGYTLATYSMTYGYNILKYLIILGLFVNTPTFNKHYPIHYHVNLFKYSEDLLLLLAQKENHINDKDFEGDTALHTVIQLQDPVRMTQSPMTKANNDYDYMHEILVLLKAGADYKTIRNNKGQTVVDNAIAIGNSIAIEVMKEYERQVASNAN